AYITMVEGCCFQGNLFGSWFGHGGGGYCGLELLSNLWLSCLLLFIGFMAVLFIPGKLIAPNARSPEFYPRASFHTSLAIVCYQLGATSRHVAGKYLTGSAVASAGPHCHARTG